MGDPTTDNYVIMGGFPDSAAFEPLHDEHEGRGANFKATDTHPALRGLHGCDNLLIAVPEVAPCLTQNYGKQPDNSDTNAGPMLVAAIQEDNQNGVCVRDTVGALRSDAPGSQPCGTLVFQSNAGRDFTCDDDCSLPLRVGSGIGLPAGPAVAFRVHGENSMAMMSDGIAHVADEVETARTLDSNGGYAKNQGGNIVLAPTVGSTLLSGGNGERGRLDPLNTDLIAFGCYDEQTPKVSENVMPTLRGRRESGGEMQFVAFQSSQSGVRKVDSHATLDSNNGSRRHNGVVQHMSVRRLTPRECERLQGVPDNYTLIPFRGKLMADGSRYKMLGNSFAIPVVRWIGERIESSLSSEK